VGKEKTNLGDQALGDEPDLNERGGGGQPIAKKINNRKRHRRRNLSTTRLHV